MSEALRGVVLEEVNSMARAIATNSFSGGLIVTTKQGAKPLCDVFPKICRQRRYEDVVSRSKRLNVLGQNMDLFCGGWSPTRIVKKASVEGKRALPATIGQRFVDRAVAAFADTLFDTEADIEKATNMVVAVVIRRKSAIVMGLSVAEMVKALVPDEGYSYFARTASLDDIGQPPEWICETTTWVVGY